MVTLVLIAILAAVTAPSVNRIIQRSDARSTARSVANHLRAAHDQAMARGEVVLVRLEELSGNADQRGAVTIFRTTNRALRCSQVDTGQVAQVGDVLRIEALSDDMEIESAPEWVCFSPEGSVRDENGDLLGAGNTCDDAAGVIWLASTETTLADAAAAINNVSEADLTDCGAVQRPELEDARYLASVWGIRIPFNGSIRAYQ